MNTNPFISSQAITLGGTVQRVLATGTTPGAELPQLESIAIKARKGNTTPLYIGIGTTGGGSNGSGISSTTGYEIQPGEAIYMDISSTTLLWVLGATTNDRYDIFGVGP